MAETQASSRREAANAQAGEMDEVFRRPKPKGRRARRRMKKVVKRAVRAALENIDQPGMFRRAGARRRRRPARHRLLRRLRRLERLLIGR